MKKPFLLQIFILSMHVFTKRKLHESILSQNSLLPNYLHQHKLYLGRMDKAAFTRQWGDKRCVGGHLYISCRCDSRGEYMAVARNLVQRGRKFQHSTLDKFLAFKITEFTRNIEACSDCHCLDLQDNIHPTSTIIIRLRRNELLSLFKCLAISELSRSVLVSVLTTTLLFPHTLPTHHQRDQVQLSLPQTGTALLSQSSSQGREVSLRATLPLYAQRFS